MLRQSQLLVGIIQQKLDTFLRLWDIVIHSGKPCFLRSHRIDHCLQHQGLLLVIAEMRDIRALHQLIPVIPVLLQALTICDKL